MSKNNSNSDVSLPAKVLIIMPAFNEEKTIGSVLDNICDLYPHYDILVVDDGSSDKTREEAEDWISKNCS